MREAARRLTLALNKIDVVYLAGEKGREITDAEYCFMYALDDGKPHSQMEICREWLIPKTTLNTITKRWEREGFLTQTAVAGKRREMAISLTERGKEYVNKHLEYMYRAEETALKKTLEQYDETFISALETFGIKLKEAFEEQNR